MSCLPLIIINILILVENVMSSLSTVLLKTLDSVLDSVLKHQCACLFQSLKIISRFNEISFIIILLSLFTPS